MAFQTIRWSATVLFLQIYQYSPVFTETAYCEQTRLCCECRNIYLKEITYLRFIWFKNQMNENQNKASVFKCFSNYFRQRYFWFLLLRCSQTSLIRFVFPLARILKSFSRSERAVLSKQYTTASFHYPQEGRKFEIYLSPIRNEN